VHVFAGLHECVGSALAGQDLAAKPESRLVAARVADSLASSLTQRARAAAVHSAAAAFLKRLGSMSFGGDGRGLRSPASKKKVKNEATKAALDLGKLAVADDDMAKLVPERIFRCGSNL
jgi:hypothetical protein